MIKENDNANIIFISMAIITILLASELAVGFLQSLLGVQGPWIIVISMVIMMHSSLNVVGFWSGTKWWIRSFLLIGIIISFCGWQALQWGEYYLEAVKHTPYLTNDLIALNGIEGMKYGGGILGKTVIEFLGHNDTNFKDTYMLINGILIITYTGFLFRK